MKHFHVEHTGTSFKFGFNEFSSLKELVMHFANQPLIGSETDKESHIVCANTSIAMLHKDLTKRNF